MTSLRSVTFIDADGGTHTLEEYAGETVLIVNVANRCGLAPQYATLEDLQRRYGDRGLQIIGFPCNQFLGKVTDDSHATAQQCSLTWGVTFPIMGKVTVNGRGTAPLYEALKAAPNVEGRKGRIRWNFEKFLVTPSNEVHRFRPTTAPDDPEIIRAIDASLPA